MACIISQMSAKKLPSRKVIYRWWLFLGASILIAACNRATPALPPELTATGAPTTIPAEPTPSHTPFQPTATSQPLAANVNGEVITLAEYEAELARYEVALGTDLATEDKQAVIDDLVNQVLLAQAAVERGYVVDEARLQARIEQLTSQLGGEQALQSWMAANGYTEDDFRRSLARSLEAAWMRDQIVSDVPLEVEQVHVRQILLYNEQDAAEVLAQLRGGADFGSLAAQYDPLSGGDLGWFPRGYLTTPELEEVAFGLKEEEISEVIATSHGFHILQLLERDPTRQLAPDALLVYQAQALSAWLAERRAQSEITILVP